MWREARIDFSVFGLISYLREQRGCKAVFLLNRAQLDDAGQKQFDDYFEKVIDPQLVLAPTSQEALTAKTVANE